MNSVNKSRKKAKKSEAIAPEREAGGPGPADRSRKRKPPGFAGSASLFHPPLAVRSDGAFLLHIDDDDDFDLAGREVWRGVVLRPREHAQVLERIEHCAHEAAAMISAGLQKKTSQS